VDKTCLKEVKRRLDLRDTRSEIEITVREATLLLISFENIADSRKQTDLFASCSPPLVSVVVGFSCIIIEQVDQICLPYFDN